MDLQSNSTIGKILKEGGASGRVTGYIHAERKDAKSFRIYPELAAGPYFEVDTRDVIDIVSEGRGEKRQTVILKGDARVQFVASRELSGRDLSPGNGPVLVPTRDDLPPEIDRLTYYWLLASQEFLNRYVGVESIPGTGTE